MADRDVNDRIDAWVDQHQDALLGFLAELVRTPSVTRPPTASEAACQRLVAAAYRDAGAEVDVFSPADVPGLREHPLFFGTWDGMPRPMTDRPDVVGVFRGSGGGKSLLLSTHVDTVAEGSEPWREAGPFSGEIHDGKLYGRGSWDTKWGIAVGLSAVNCVKALGLPLRGDVTLESVVDEEFGGSHGVLAARLRGYNADFAINSEPTSMIVAPAHRGGGEWRITVKGDAGMDFGDRELTNPVYKLARVIDAIRAFDVARNRNPQPPPFFENDPALPSYTMQIGGGGDTYAEAAGIPPECYLLAWIEEFPGVSRNEHVARFTGFVNDFLAHDPDFDGVYPDYTPTIRYLPGSSVDPAHPFFDALAAAYRGAGKAYRLGGAPFAADTYVFNLASPTPAITLGPGGGNAHGADEHVLVADVVDLVRIYARAILAWCG
ncbi:MAG TPA: M20/M25/M40 family metallo-hydrolase [Thermomicrobiales bacterium]|jgi:acetylornithine deacetylase|nr:M20/M25/M40 family metallo-hydrolase [Thermomicrobiales bacterium]